MPQVRIKNGPQKNKVLVVARTGKVSIGRDEACDLQLADQGASREHAQLFRLGEMVFIRDLQSRNGTFVNEERITEELLREGDLVRIGNTRMVFEATHSPEVKPGEVQYEDGQDIKASLDLKVEDLYVAETDAVEREAALFKAVCQSTQILQSERDETKLLDRLLELINQFVPADYLYVFLKDEQTGLIVPRAARHPKGAAANYVPISRTILRRVISESRAILTDNAMQDDRFKRDDSIIMHRIRSVLCAPVRSSAQACGAIYAVNADRPETFDQNDLQLLTALGAQLALALENLQIIRGRRRLLLRTIGRMVSLLEGAPTGRCGHAERVSSSAAAIAAEMNLSEPEILYASMSALLHDIGKVPAVAQAVTASGAASASTHIAASLDFLRDVPDLIEALPGIEYYHERYDGEGAERQLRGDALPLTARVLAVANGLDHQLFPNGQCTQDEPDATVVRNALLHLAAEAGKSYDPRVAAAAMVAYRHGTLRFSTRRSAPPAADDNLLLAEPPGDKTEDPVILPAPPVVETVRTQPAKRKADRKR